MVKDLSLYLWIAEYNGTLELINGDSVHCIPCKITINSKRRKTVTTHLESINHRINAESSGNCDENDKQKDFKNELINKLIDICKRFRRESKRLRHENSMLRHELTKNGIQLKRFTGTRDSQIDNIIKDDDTNNDIRDKIIDNSNHVTNNEVINERGDNESVIKDFTSVNESVRSDDSVYDETKCQNYDNTIVRRSQRKRKKRFNFTFNDDSNDNDDGELIEKKSKINKQSSDNRSNVIDNVNVNIVVDNVQVKNEDFSDEIIDISSPSVSTMKRQTEKDLNKYLSSQSGSDKRFYSPYLNCHMLLPTNEKPFKCEFCESGFMTAQLLDDHMKSHGNGEPLTCLFPACHMKFIDHNSFSIHETTHLNQTKLFKCSLPGCNYSYKIDGHFSNNLKKHLEKHKNERPYACKWPGCGLRSFTMNELEKHYSIHTGDRPFQCRKCKRQFVCEPNVKNHICNVTK